MQNFATTRADTASAHTAEIQKQRAEKLSRENAVARGELIPRGDVIAGGQSAVAHMRSRLLAIPSKAAPAVVIMETVAAIKEHLTELVHDALEEISETRFVAVPQDKRRANDGAGVDGNRAGRKAAADDDGQRVVGRKPVSKRGKQRGARKVGNRKG